MAETKGSIAEAKAESSRLLQRLSETDYAPSAANQASSYVKEVEQDIAKNNKLIEQLAVKLKKEAKDVEKYRDSTSRRWAYKITGQSSKFDTRAEKEEREWLEAVQERKKAEDAGTMLKTQLKEAEQTRDNYTKVANEHASLQKQLDSLYSRVFDGPTPDFPEEDAQESVVREADTKMRDVQAKADAEAQVVGLLGNADQLMVQASRNIQSARSASTADLIGFGGSFADYAERNALQRAQSATWQIEILVNQAKQWSPFVNDIGPLRIAQQNFLTDVLFDNIFTDLAMHEKIKESEIDVARASANLKGQLQAANQRLAALKAELSEVNPKLKEARKELQRVRQQAIEKAAAGSI